MKINILGTDYTIKVVKISKCDLLRERHWCGSCNNIKHEILIGDPREEEYFGKMSEEEQLLQTKRTLRHEITHAFLNESGLQNDSSVPGGGWATNEEMIDWFALQSPKIYKAFKEADCL